MKNKTLILIIVIALVVIIACIPIGYYLMTHGFSNGLTPVSGTARASAQSAQSYSEADAASAGLAYETMTLDGKTYEYRSNLRNYLFLGIDKRELEETQAGYANAGQCDALFLLSWDPNSGAVTMISIPRDTITEITIYTSDGTYHQRTQDHISLSYGYGDGKSMSCTLSARAVSNLLGGIPITGYMALDLDSLPVIMDTVGSFEVTIPNESLTYTDPSLTEGTVLTIDSSNVEMYVRSRDSNVDGSPLLRLERQKTFLEALQQKMIADYEQQPGTVAKLYLNLGDYMITNIAQTSLSSMLEDLAEHDLADEWTVPGTAVTREYDEYYPDADALQACLAETFYTVKN